MSEEERTRARQWLARYTGGPGEHRVELGDMLAAYAREAYEVQHMRVMLGAIKAWCSRNGHTYAERLAMSGLGELGELGEEVVTETKVQAVYLKTHCEHGALRTDHCPWCCSAPSAS
jgi:hypothetical protein